MASEHVASSIKHGDEVRIAYRSSLRICQVKERLVSEHVASSIKHGDEVRID